MPRKVVNEFRSITTSPSDLADLMICPVDNGVEFTHAFGDINEPFYVSIERMYDAACKHIAGNNLRNTFQTRCADIMSDTHHLGCGCHDMLSEI